MLFERSQQCKGLTLLAVMLVSLLASNSARSGLELTEPASFEGTLPCADCPGIDWHLDLWPDGRFHLRRQYRAREANDDDLGRWRINPADASLLLFGGREAPLRLAIIDNATVRLLDTQGRAIDSALPYELHRRAVFAPTEIRQSMGGEFVYYADTASFHECRTGHKYPVTMEGDYLNAERRYLGSRRQEMSTAEPLFLQIRGAIVNRQAMPPEGPPQSLLIERLVADVPGLRCERTGKD